jgi:mono/diheme cytochrome c family protein
MTTRTKKTMLYGAAIAGLLLSAAGPASAAEPDAKTTRTWKAKCASCHGVDGKAKTEMGKKLDIPDFTTKEWQKKVSDETMRKSISEGVKREGKAEGMEAYKEKLDAAQIDGMIAIVRGLAAK